MKKKRMRNHHRCSSNHQSRVDCSFKWYSITTLKERKNDVRYCRDGKLTDTSVLLLLRETGSIQSNGMAAFRNTSTHTVSAVWKKQRRTCSPFTNALHRSSQWKSHLMSRSMGTRLAYMPWANSDFDVKRWIDLMICWSEQEVLCEWRDVSTRPQCGLKIQRQRERVHRKGIHWQEGKSTDREPNVRPCGIIIIIAQNINHTTKTIVVIW